MGNERLMMEGKLAGLIQKQTRLRAKAKGLCIAISPAINPLLKPVEKLAIATAAQQMDELVMVQAELLVLQDEIEALEDALGN